MKPIAVTILNWNGAKLLKEYLPSVVAHTPSDIADIIVADNGSTDDSLRLLKEEFRGVKVLEFPKNYGFAEGYNRAAKMMSEYKYTVLLNSDVKVMDDWLTPLYRYMEGHPEVAAIQPKIHSSVETNRFEYAGAAGGFLDRNGYPFCRGRFFSITEPDEGQYDGPAIETEWATGACLMTRTGLYNSVGGLDPLFFAHMEEIDLCWRLRATGYRVMASTDSVVYHLGGGSLPADNPRKTYLNFRNSLLMLYKNLPLPQRGWLIIKRRLLDTLAFGMFVAKLDFKNALAIVKAHNDFRRMKKEYELKDFYTATGTERIPLPSSPNIIVQYYLKGRKTYSEIRKVTKPLSKQT